MGRTRRYDTQVEWRSGHLARNRVGLLLLVGLAFVLGVHANDGAIAAPVLPAPVTGLTVEPLPDGTMRLSWSSSPTPPVAFAIYRWRWGIGEPLELAGVIEGGRTGFTDNQGPVLESSTLYYYWVVASNEAGGTWSVAVSAVTAGGPPGAPRDITAVSVVPGVIDVNWTDTASNELGVILWRFPGPGTDLNSHTTLWLPANTTSYEDRDLEADRYYRYWVWTWGWNGYSTSPYVTLLTPRGCVPELLTPQPGDYLDNGRSDGNDSVDWHFDWTDCAGAEAYEVKLVARLVPAASNTFFGPVSTQNSELDNHCAGCAYPTGYPVARIEVYIRAKVAGSWGVWSPPISVRFEPVDTDPPQP